MKEYFTITEDHIKLIRRMYVWYDSWTEFGAPEIDPKRPYGNGDVYRDIAEILDIESDENDEFSDEEYKYMRDLHKSTTTVIQIMLQKSPIDAGTYETEKYRNNWEKATESTPDAESGKDPERS